MKIILEKQTDAFIKSLAAKGGKPIYKLTPAEARALLEKMQNAPVEKQAVKIEKKVIQGTNKSDISIQIVRPANAVGRLPAILYIHGGGWVMGSANTHDRLVRELAVGSNAALVFVNYSRSPEAKFPLAIEECYTTLKYIAANGHTLNLDTSRLAVVGDSVGGNMAIAVTLLAKERGGPKIDCQVLFYPVTSGEMNTPSYHQLAEGPWLTKAAMGWFWDAYEPNVMKRKNHLISPLQATTTELQGLPSALIITAEHDVLHDEGEQYASRLMQAGNEVTATRFLGTIHDFVMLNALANTPAVRGAITLANNYLTEVFTKQAKGSSKTRRKVA